MNEKLAALTVAIFCLIMFGGCASIISGTDQNIIVKTGKTSGSSCSLSNDKGSWTVSDTPGSIMIKKSMSDLSLVCKKDSKTKERTVQSSVKGLIFANLIFFPIGTVIGGGIDCYTGAGFDYPNEIDVDLN